MVVKACQALAFAKSRGQTPVTLLTLKGCGRHLNSPFFQLMSGFSSFNHGNPRMIFCFPNPVTSILMFYQNSECRSYEVMLKAGYWGCGMSGVTGSAGVYYVGARTRPQLIGCALAQEPGVLNFGLRVANNGGR